MLLPLGLLMLSLAVFGWGLQYKLSLYQSKDSITHLAPEAKLLSQKERPAAVQANGQLSRSPAWPLILMIALAFALCEAARRYFRIQDADLSRQPLPAYYRNAFVRPPPAHSFPL